MVSLVGSRSSLASFGSGGGLLLSLLSAAGGTATAECAVEPATPRMVERSSPSFAAALRLGTRCLAVTALALLRSETHSSVRAGTTAPQEPQNLAP